ncbi:cytochrome P450 [Roridomyces roridus]|uniref:Cytochrome P450 n=1 Tax=Roridomyces roridus TaxID=1738132 RepID=A0AAD7CC84_9AGAR|nr:cytochrome P450 [Roridomyces roridus]
MSKLRHLLLFSRQGLGSQETRSPAFTVALTALLAIICCHRYLRRRSTGTPFPPGPPGLPILGNLLHLPSPTQHPWFKFTEWKDVFGDIVYLHGLGNSIVVLNSLDATTDLLSKHGHLYAERPVFTMVGELMGLDRSMPVMSSTKTWQLHRRLAHTAFSPEAVKKYHRSQEDIAVLTSLAFANYPKRFIDHVRLATGRIVMSVTYGISPQVAEHDYIAHAEDTMMLISRTMVPGAFLVDVIPALKYIPRHLPFRTFHDTAREGRAMMEKMVFPPFFQVKNEMAGDGPKRPSFVSDLLSMPRDNTPLEEAEFQEAVKWTAGSMYGAGGETTYSTVLNFILAMALHPSIQLRAQEEMDAIIGPERLPTIADRASTPYLNAVLKETLRWHPSLPLGLPHRSSKDFVYRGYHIPGDSIVIPNIWAVSRTPDPDFPPEDFVPERFLPRSFEPIDPFSYVFGFGRRICPGKSLAESSIYIVVAYLLHCFSFHPPLDEKGEEKPIEPTWKTGLTSFPNPFECRIVLREESRVVLLEERAAQCDES